MYTAAVMNGLAEGDPELFDLYYGGLDDRATPPGEVHYISFTATVYMNSRAPAPASPDRRTTLPGGAPPPIVVSSRRIPNGIRSIPLTTRPDP